MRKCFSIIAARWCLVLSLAGTGLVARSLGAQDDPFGDSPPPKEATVDDLFDEPRPQPKPPAPKPEEPLPDATRPAAPPASGFEVELLDGTVLRGELDLAEIAIATKYGQLQIPLTEVVSISPGLNTRSELKQHLGKLIEQLGSDAYAERQQAQADLIALGPQVAELVRAASTSDNAERAARAKAVLEKFAALEQTWGPSGAAPLNEHDEVNTREFAASGQVQLKQLTISGLYGTVTVDLQHIKSLRRASAIQPQETFATTKVGGEHNTSQKPFNSQIIVRRGDTISIRASGTLKSPSHGYQLRPDGTANYGVYNEAQRIMAGALLVQIGEGGEAKLAGSKTSFVADADGPLLFSVAAPSSLARHPIEGSYDVNVRVSSRK